MTTEQAPPQAGRRSRFAERSLLRNPLPAIAATITIFLVVLALMIARLAEGGDPALHPLASAPAVTAVAGHGHAVLRTTPSGRRVLTEAPGAQTASGANLSALVTRTSGAGRHDD